MRLVAGTLAAIVFLVAPPASGRLQDSSRTIEEDIRVPLPLGPCDLPGLVGRIAFALKQPAGIEFLPGRCPPTAGSDARTERWSGRGLTFQEALNQLIRLDPRYGWADDGGVIVVRPMAAVNDADHFLHRTLRLLTVADGTLDDGLDSVSSALGPLEFKSDHRQAGPLWDARFSLSLRNSSAISALGSIVRIHGASMWSVEYCQPEHRYEYALIRLTAFDGHSSGRRVNPNRAKTDPCASTPAAPRPRE